MSTFRSDPFSRRPNDERRPSDPRDRRRESYGRSVSDTHDRYRDRGRDDSPPRERGSVYDTGRESTKQPHTISSRFDPTASRGTKSSSDGHTNIDGISCLESIGRALTSWTKNAEVLFVEKARLMYHKEQLQKVQAQRKSEYQRSMHKHADFPAIPELQSKYRARDDAELKKLESHERKTDERLLKLREMLPSELLQALSTADFQRRSDTKETSSQASMKEVESKLTALKSDLQQHQDNSKGNQDVLRARVTELEGRNAQQQKEFKSDLAEIQQEFRQQLQSLRQDLDKQQTSMIQDQATKFESQLSKQEASIKTLIEKQHEELTSCLEKATASTLATLREENAALRSENDTLRSVFSSTANRVEELAAKLERQIQDAKRLQESVDSCRHQMEDQRQKVDDHQGKLMHIDTQIWDEMADTCSFAFPRLRGVVERLRADVERLQQTHQQLPARKGSEERPPPPSWEKTFEAKARVFQDQIILKVGEYIDELRANVTALKNRDADLQAQITSLETGAQSKSRAQGPPNPEAVEDLKREYATLLQQFSQTKEELKEVSDDVSQKTNYLTHQFNILQSQYNNLTTKDLAQYIVGQLETLYPDSRKLVADIGQLSATTEKMKKDQAEHAGEVKAAKQEFTELKRKVEDILLPPVRDWVAEGYANKKRKAEVVAENDLNEIGSHARTNGVRSLNGDGKTAKR